MTAPMSPTQLPAPEGQAGPQQPVIQYKPTEYSRNEVSRRIADTKMTDLAKQGWRLVGPVEVSINEDGSDSYLATWTREVGATLPPVEYLVRFADNRDIATGYADTAMNNRAAQGWRLVGPIKPTVDNLHVITGHREIPK